MLSAILTVTLSIIAGASLAFFGLAERRRIATSIDAFALIASLAVVLGHLLPHAITAIGLLAFIPFFLALALPALLERAIEQGEHPARHGAALELSYLGLLFHQFGDGLGLGVFSSGPHEGHLHLDLMLGVGAHTVPIATLMTSAFLRERGARSAAFRAAGLILSGALGVTLARRIPGELLVQADPWISAAVGGLLLHIVMDDPESGEQRQRPSRPAEALALTFGFALLFFGGGYDHTHGTEPADDASIGLGMLEILRIIAVPISLGLAMIFTLPRLMRERVEAIKRALERASLPPLGVFMTAIILAALLDPLAFVYLGVAIAIAAQLAATLRLRPLGKHPATEGGIAAQLTIGVLIGTYLKLAGSGGLSDFLILGAIALAAPRSPLLILPIGLALGFSDHNGALGPLALGLALTLSIDAPALIRARSPRLVLALFFTLLSVQLTRLGGAALTLNPPELPLALERAAAALLVALFFVSLLRGGTRALIGEILNRRPEEPA